MMSVLPRVMSGCVALLKLGSVLKTIACVTTQKLCGCPVSGLPPEAILLSEGQVPARVILI